MAETCTLIKNSDLAKMQDEIKNNRKLRTEWVEKKTKELKEDIEARDKKILELEAKIKDMEENPQVDPMRMEITMMERHVSTGSRYGIESDNRYPYVRTNPINFNLDYSIRKQIFNIATIVSKRDIKIFEEEIDKRVKDEVSKKRDYWVMKAYESAAKMGFWELKKFLKRYKNKNN